jgi:hypothetical protein
VKLHKLNESWGDEGIQDPTKSRDITYSGELMHTMAKSLDPTRWRIGEIRGALEGVTAIIQDKRDGTFYNITIKPDLTKVKLPTTPSKLV